MTSQIRTFALAALAVLASMTTLHAQNTIRAQVNVPFSFDYGTTHFGHGTYVLSMNGPNSLVVRNQATGQQAMILAQMAFDPAPSSNSLVTFKKYGDRYFLEEVSIANSETRVTVYEGKAERHAARELAQRGVGATEVALALAPARPLGN